MRKDFGTKTKVCPTCGINCWDKTDNKPAIWPCNVVKCPWEPNGPQPLEAIEFSKIGNALAQIE